MEEEQSKSKMKEFYIRLISGVVIFFPVLFAIFFGGLLYFSLLFLLIILSTVEWNKIGGNWSFGTDSMCLASTITLSSTTFLMNHVETGLIIIMLGSYFTYVVSKIRLQSEKMLVIPEYINRPLWMLLGSIYLSLGFFGLSYITVIDKGVSLIWLFFAVIISDVSAYIFGSLIGGRKIWVRISPGKTWSGLVAAVICTSIFSYVWALLVGANNELFVMLIGCFIAIFAHIGDMLESSFKRYLKIKDTSNLIPGHGGVLDRIDAMLMVGFFISLLSLLIGSSPLLF